MNSRGTLMTHRITGDTLAISDSVAMTPTVQPAAAGTQRSRDFDWLRGRDAVRVTDCEDIRSSYEMCIDEHRIARVARAPQLWSSRLHRGHSGLGGWVTELSVMTARITCATVSGEVQRQQVETHSHRWLRDPRDHCQG